MTPKKLQPNGGKMTVGWREWLALPDLAIPAVKTKIDTGARTSALHVFDLTVIENEHGPRVRFGIHPLQRRKDIEIYCEADVFDRRRVRDSGGHVEWRYVIWTNVALAGSVWPIEVTLTNREDMLFRMLLGRTALSRRFMVDPARSYVSGRRLPQVYADTIYLPRERKGKRR